MVTWFSSALSWITQIVLGLCLIALASSYLSLFWGAPWAPTSLRTAKEMLQMAQLQPGQTLVDLGAAFGRIVILAAKRFGARALGVEIDPIRCLLANAAIALFGVRGKAKVYHANMHSFDLSPADVVTLYLLQGTNQRIKPQLLAQLRPGTKVISHAFSLSDWSPVAIDERRRIFVYEIGSTGPEVKTRFA